MDIVAFGLGLSRAVSRNFRVSGGQKQELDVYFQDGFAAELESWGNDTAWRELQFHLGERQGRVLDLACGTGRALDFIKRFKKIEYYGCDISEKLIAQALARGISAERVSVQDATKMSYQNDYFDFLFSIGSLEHFTEGGLRSTIKECRRVCKGVSFHQVPVSKSGFNEGWVNSTQSYWNNSEQWWLSQFEEQYPNNVWVLPSKWQDRMSRGVWFVTVHDDWSVNAQ